MPSPFRIYIGRQHDRAVETVALAVAAAPYAAARWHNHPDPPAVGSAGRAGEVDAALTKALPRLLREVREVVGERRVTIVFDRGGWSPKLFGTMIKDGFDLLTYRKGRCRRINERRFIRRRAQLDGRWVDYLLHDQPVGFLKGKLRLRQVTRLCDGGHQTQVITSRWDLRDIEVAYRMFSTSMRRTIRCTASRRGGSSTVITIATALIAFTMLSVFSAAVRVVASPTKFQVCTHRWHPTRE